MPCDCQHEDNVEIQHRTLVLLLAINAMMFCLEVVAGILANSTALLADSLDMFADATVYGIALYAVGKPNSVKRRTAFTSGILQGLLGLLVIGEVIRHFLYGSEPRSLVMKVLDQNMSVSTALPCRISIYEEGVKTILATLKPTALLAMFSVRQLESVAQEVEDAIIKIMKEASAG
jgi:hypothetical protein